MELLKEIESWKSIRRFSEIQVENSVLEKVLKAGRKAPSWQNLQPWHFLVMTDSDDKKILSSIAVTKKLTQKAPVIIAILGNLQGFTLEKSFQSLREQFDSKMNDEKLKEYLNHAMASPELISKEIVAARVLEQLSYASAWMLLEAGHQGLGCCILGGIENCLTQKTSRLKEVKDHFQIPESYEIFSLIALGYPAEDPAQRSRKAVQETVSFHRFGTSAK